MGPTPAARETSVRGVGAGSSACLPIRNERRFVVDMKVRVQSRTAVQGGEANSGERRFIPHAPEGMLRSASGSARGRPQLRAPQGARRSPAAQLQGAREGGTRWIRPGRMDAQWPAGGRRLLPVLSGPCTQAGLPADRRLPHASKTDGLAGPMPTSGRTCRPQGLHACLLAPCQSGAGAHLRWKRL